MTLGGTESGADHSGAKGNIKVNVKAKLKNVFDEARHRSDECYELDYRPAAGYNGG